MIDSHCHLDLSAFEHDINQVIDRAKQSGVSRLHIPGTTQRGWHRQQMLAKQFKCIDYSFGLHPYFLHANSESAIAQLEQDAANDSKVSAIGEIGLDAACKLDWSLQVKTFEQQLHIAKALNLPVIIHHRKTHHHIMQSLKKVNFNNGGVIHAFSGSYETACAYVDKGFMLGIGGTITYPRANKTKNTLLRLGLANILLETDCPDMPPRGLQGKRNEPSNLRLVVDSITALLELPALTVIEQTTENYWRVFG